MSASDPAPDMPDTPPPPDGRPDLSDEAFLASLADASMPPASFKHRSHLRLAWLHLREGATEAGVRSTVATIRSYADAIDASERYNETLTDFWIRAVSSALRRHPEIGSLDELVEAAPELDDPGLQYRYWSPEVLKSDRARQRWVAPDRAPLPA